jgi:hypothetical protein
MIQAPSNYLPPDPSQQQQYAAAQQMLVQALLAQSQQPQDASQSAQGGGFGPAQAMQMYKAMQPFGMGGGATVGMPGGITQIGDYGAS